MVPVVFICNKVVLELSNSEGFPRVTGLLLVLRAPCKLQSLLFVDFVSIIVIFTWELYDASLRVAGKFLVLHACAADPLLVLPGTALGIVKLVSRVLVVKVLLSMDLLVSGLVTSFKSSIADVHLCSAAHASSRSISWRLQTRALRSLVFSSSSESAFLWSFFSSMRFSIFTDICSSRAAWWSKSSITFLLEVLVIIRPLLGGLSFG